MASKTGFSHESTGCKSVEWYTPPWVFERLGLRFDLDPCHPHDRVLEWVPAASRYTIFDNGLMKPWDGKVWLNPPYSKHTPLWMRRMAAHGNGVAMVFSRTDAAWFHEAIQTADALLLMKGRIQFVPGKENEDKRSRTGAGTAMFAWGEECTAALERMSDLGFFVKRKWSW